MYKLEIYVRKDNWILCDTVNSLTVKCIKTAFPLTDFTNTASMYLDLEDYKKNVTTIEYKELKEKLDIVFLEVFSKTDLVLVTLEYEGN